MDITIYTTISCPYCEMEKEYLESHGLEYQEKRVDEDNQARAEMSEISEGFLGVPFTVIKKEDGSQESVVGFDKNRLSNILGL